MGKKSLKAQIVAEVNKRQKELETQKAAELAQQKEELAHQVWESLDIAFSNCLKSYSNYFGHKVKSYTVDRGFYEMAKELGFTVSLNNKYEGYEDDFYMLTIPEFNGGNGKRRTQAQRRLFEFEKRLKQARKERTAEILAECEKVKRVIESGNYNYTIDGHTSAIQISVVPNFEVAIRFEKDIIEKFFKKYKLTLNICDSTMWSFYLL